MGSLNFSPVLGHLLLRHKYELPLLLPIEQGKWVGKVAMVPLPSAPFDEQMVDKTHAPVSQLFCT